MKRLIPHKAIMCHAHNNRGEPCKNLAMENKDVCRFHGGKTPIKHGLYSKYGPADPRLAEVYDEFLKGFEDNPLSLKNLQGEIALIKAFLQTLIEKAPQIDGKTIDFISQLILKLSWIIEKHVKINEGEKHIIVPQVRQAFETSVDKVIELAKEYIEEKKFDEFLTRLNNAITNLIPQQTSETSKE